MCVSVGRRPYSTRAKLFRDSDVEVEILWYECQPDALDLPVPTRIVPRFWYESVRRQNTGGPVYTGVGEVWDAPRPNQWPAPKPTAFGTHYCGTPEDFAEGCAYRPDLPPVERNQDGLPLCCGHAAVGQGGAMVGGTAVAEVVTPPTTWGDVYGIAEVAVTVDRVSSNTWWQQPVNFWILSAAGTPNTPANWTLQTVGPSRSWTTTGWDGVGTRIFDGSPFNPPGTPVTRTVTRVS